MSKNIIEFLSYNGWIDDDNYDLDGSCFMNYKDLAELMLKYHQEQLKKVLTDIKDNINIGRSKNDLKTIINQHLKPKKMKKFIVLGIATKKADKQTRELPIMSNDEKTVMRYDTKKEALEAIKFWKKQGLVKSYEVFESM